ncbi:MAG: phosphate/phosphite/phosphonate ABC transporter substrate-binding protein, partial [Epsilonproteobacteria bacterium]|nr:phosphate/phosphite/phosphonate ABC transporter substrate-binding protein [Campylobacterota bacterium]
MISYKKSLLFAMFLPIYIVLIAGCGDSKKKNIELQKISTQNTQIIKATLGAIITPRGGIIYYKSLFKYLGKKIGKKIEIINKDSYKKTNQMLKNCIVDIGFVCSGPYVSGHKNFGLELLAVPVVDGKTTYNSYIIVRKNSKIDSLRQLQGKTFAFTDPQSNSGKTAPTYMLAKMHETPKTFFKKIIYTQGHDKSIWAVVEHIVDGAAVDSLIWNYMNKTDPTYTSKTKIIAKSQPYAIPPFVVRKGLNKKIKSSLRRALLSMNKDKEG